jgi:hypothetical protein
VYFGTMAMRKTFKERLEEIPTHLPLIANASDPVVAAALWLVFLAATAGLIWAHRILPSDHEARTHIIQIAGGIVVLFGSYFAANRLAVQRSQQRAEMLRKLLDHLGSSRPAVRVGAVRLMESLALEPPANRVAAGETQGQLRAIHDALTALRASEDCDSSTARALTDVLDRLPSFEESDEQN